ncbi:FxsA family protein [Lysinibacillus endophyticus]|uniref:FxsA family protein n=1 Tax=Ureibacillus endophyticus TaxID=1978490 RepID=UPI0031353D1D
MRGRSELRKIFLGLIATMLIEIAIFILVGKTMGIFNTLLLIVLTSIVGIVVAKKQGIDSIQNMQSSLSNGIPPGPAMIDTFLIFLGGLLLAVPGFLTDIVGFLMVVPFTRKLFKPVIYNWLRRKFKNGQVYIYRQ